MTARRRRTKKEITRARCKARAARKHHLKTVHRMTMEQYDAIKEFQGGACYICKRATGATRSLAVEHDHKIAETCDHLVNESCERCWRGLCCSVDNKFLGHGRDSVEFFERIVAYLKDPPAQRWRRENSDG